MNRIFAALVAIAFAVAACRHLVLDLVLPRWWTLPLVLEKTPLDLLTSGAMDGAKAAVTLAIGLIGAMAFFLGLMKVAEEGGLLSVIAKVVRPLMVRLFPEVPHDHPAMGAMILNLSANALGLGNAATPFGIRAMQELDKLNPQRGTATDAMVLFLCINASSVTLLPTGVIAIRESLGSDDPAGILATTLFATLCSTSVAITCAFLFARLAPVGVLSPAPQEPAAAPAAAPPPTDALEDHGAYPLWVSAVALLAVIGLIPVMLIWGEGITPWIVPLLIVGLLGYGWVQGVSIYEAFIRGARDGFDTAVRIIPFLVAILAAVGMLRESGALGAFVGAVGTYTGPLGMPAEALPMALIRPLSGSGAFGVLMETLNAHGPDSYVGYLVSTIQGSTETTFYVVAVYFGAVGVQRTRHAVPAALMADVAGLIGSVVAVTVYWRLNVVG